MPDLYDTLGPYDPKLITLAQTVELLALDFPEQSAVRHALRTAAAKLEDGEKAMATLKRMRKYAEVSMEKIQANYGTITLNGPPEDKETKDG